MGWSAWGAIGVGIALVLFAFYEAKTKANDDVDYQ